MTRKIKSGPLYLVIDQGGQSSRALAFDQQRNIVSQAALVIKTFREGSQIVEHDAEEIISSITSAIEQCLQTIDTESILCAGLACQRSSIVCWDRKTGESLSPVLSWQDTRASDTLTKLSSHADTIHKLSGLFLSAHYGASKLRWCLEHLPGVCKAHEEKRLAFGPLSSFILFRLLEERPLLVDPVCASRTLLWNLQTLDWDSTLMELFDIPQNCLPRCVANQFDYGHLQTASTKIPFRLCTGDQAAALFMSGPPDPETVYVNIGTGAFLQRKIGQKKVNAPRLLSSVVWQSDKELSYVLEGTVNGAASALQKISQELNIDDHALSEILERETLSFEKPLLFLNGISGLGSPYWQSEFSSGFIGEGATPDKLLAVLESIVFLIQANLDEMNKFIDTPHRIIVSGGLSAITGLCQRLASLSGLPLQRTQNQEATAQGLASLLCGSTESIQENMLEFEALPNPGLKKRYERWCYYMSE